MLSIYIHRRGLMTKTFTSTTISRNVVKTVFWRGALCLTKIEWHIDIRATDDILKVGVEMSSIWMHRRGLMIKTSYITETSHDTSTKCVLMRHLLTWQWMSSVVSYELMMAYPRLELICRPHGCIEAVCRLQYIKSRKNCTIQALNVSWQGHWNGPKLSSIVIVWSL